MPEHFERPHDSIPGGTVEPEPGDQQNVHGANVQVAAAR
jgi:hypothetical protein